MGNHWKPRKPLASGPLGSRTRKERVSPLLCHDQPNVADEELVGGRCRIVREDDRRGHRLSTLQGDIGARCRREAHLLPLQRERPEPGRQRTRQPDVVARRGAGGVRSLLQRMQTGNRHPVAAVIGLVLGAPLLHLLDVIGGQRVASSGDGGCGSCGDNRED